MLIDITVELRHETAAAILVHDGDQQVWLPKSQVEWVSIRDNTIEVTLPEWLALEKGLV